jgi:hypothetical protein
MELMNRWNINPSDPLQMPAIGLLVIQADLNKKHKQETEQASKHFIEGINGNYSTNS